VEPKEAVPAHAPVATTTEEPSKRRMVGNETFVYDTREVGLPRFRGVLSVWDQAI
jgi:hypothetical protein